MRKAKSNGYRKGAPKKPEGTTIARGKPWTLEQEEWLKEEAQARNMTMAEIVREAVDWYRTSKENARENVIKQPNSFE